jgi:hypothetical protein
MGIEEEKSGKLQEDEKELPLCLNCLRPVNPLDHYCPNCGRAIGQLTPVMPYESLRWQADIWGSMWHQLWSKDVSFTGKLFRLFMIIWFVPVILIGIIPKLWQKKEARNDR